MQLRYFNRNPTYSCTEKAPGRDSETRRHKFGNNSAKTLSLACARAKVDLVFAFDASTSVKEEGFYAMKDFIKDFLFITDIDSGNARVGVLIFSNEGYIAFHLNTYRQKQAIYDAIDAIPYPYGNRNTADGLSTLTAEMFTRQNGDRPDVPNIVVVLTGGVSNINSRRTIPEAEQARADGIHIYAIGISLTDTTELDGIASKPVDENRFSVKGFSELRNLRDVVYAAYCPRTTPPALTLPPSVQKGCDEAEIDLVFILDASTSVTEPNFELMKDFVKDFLFIADIDNGNVRVGVIIYSTEDYVQFQLNSHRTKFEVFDAIDEIPYRYGSTNTADALKTMRTVMYTPQNGDRPNVPNICIVITDGVSNINSRRTIPEAEQARADGIHIYAIGIGLTDRTELDGIASKPASENSFAVQEFSELRVLRDQVFAAFCPSCDEAEIDLVFILDASTSVTEPNFELMKDFVKDFLFIADIDNGNVRVGVIIYSTEDYVQFQLNSYRTKFEVFDAIDEIPYRYGSTNTADALKTMRTVMYTPQNGDRPNVPNICIVVTDGVSNINSRRTIPEAEQARADGIHIYAIGIGLTDTTELDGIASKPASENSFAVQEFSELRVLRDQVFAAFCPSCDEAEIDLVFILDASTSVTEPNFELMKDFVKDFLFIADIDNGNVRVGVIIYSTEDYVQFQLNSYRTKFEVFDAIDEIPYRYGSTNTADALKTMRTVMYTPQNGDRPNVPNICIVITDGVSNINSRRTIPEAEQARAEGIHIYAIGIGLTDTRELDGMASVPASENSFAVQEFSELRVLRDQVFAAFCPTTPPPLTLPPAVSGCADAEIDLVFILDASTSVTEPNFELMKDFVKDFLFIADIDNGNVRVGVIIYSTEDYVQFQLNSYRTKFEVFDAIDEIPYRYGSTNTADALKTMRTVMYTPQNGDRPNVPNICIVVTDGVSNINSRRTIPEAEQARAEGIHIYAIGIGLTDTTELDGIASKPASENSFAVQEFSELRVLRDKVFEAFCPSCDEAEIDLVFILDASTSVTEPNFELMKDFVKDFLFIADIDNGNVRVGVIIYSTEDYVQFQLNSYRTKFEVFDAIDEIPYRYGSTNTADALKTMRTVMYTPQNGDRPNVPNICIVITDGVSNINSRRTIPEAEQARAEGIHIYAIGIGLTDTRELDGMASVPASENSFAVQEFSELRVLRDQVFAAFCPTTPPPITLPPVIKGCDEAEIDLVFILDASTSVTEPNFELMKDFVKDFLFIADIDNGNVRVGVIIYSTEDYVQFQLNSYRTKFEVFDAIDEIPYRYGSTNTADALKTMRTVMYTPQNGDRPNVPNICIVVTDGVSNINSRRTIPEAEQARADGIHIYAIGIGLTDTRELDGMASVPASENSFAVQEFSELRVLRDQVFAAFCPGCADAKIDLVFILDASTSVTEPNFELMKDFVKDFLFIADIDNGNVRVGVIIYSTEDYLQFNLNEYKTKFEVFDAIDEIPYRYGSTNTADALKTMRTVMYTPQNGDRPNVPNICIVVTDGVSNINSRRTIPEAEQARAEGIHIYAIGIGLTDTRELDGMASVPASENSFAVQEFSELRALRDKVFEAFCPGTPAPITLPPKVTGCADAKIDLVFILDASTSVTEPNFELMKDFVKDFLFIADIDNGNVRVGVIIYSTEDYLQFNLNEYSSKFEVFDAIDEIPYRYGSTNTADALKTMRTVMYTPQNGDRPNVPNICIVVTDGVSNINSRRTIPEAEKARADGIHIYAIGIGLTDTTELDGIASVPASENSFAVQEFSELRALRDKVFEAFCPGTPAPITLPPKVTGCADAKIDLVFILDASTSVTEPNFELMKDFVKDFLFIADIDNGNVRVGVIIYSTEDYLQFNLNEYSSKFEVFDAIDEIPYRYGSTNTADALKTMRTVMYTPQNGDRPNVPNICIVVTDGVSNINSRRTIPEAEQARADGIHIYAIGIGLTDTTELDGIASVPASENSFAVQEFSELRALRDKVFEAFCPGTPAPITLPPKVTGCADAKIDLVFILDASTSVTEPNFELMKDFVKDFLFVADIDNGNVRVGVIIYSTEDYLQFNLNEYSSKFEVFDAIDEIPYRYGSTNTADALKTMRTVMYTPQNGDRPNVPNICIVVTDGVSNINSRRTIPEAEQARADGIHIYAIGIGLTDTTELDGIASVPASENSFAVQEFSELRALRDKVFEAFCPGTPAPITLPPKVTGCADAKIDLVFILDASTSVTEPNFELMKDFVKDFLFVADIDNGNVRVGVIIYSTEDYLQFNLNEYSSKFEVFDAIDEIPYRYGSTNTADALKTMRTVMYTPQNGDRPNVPNICIVVTDGVSNINSRRTIPEAEQARADGIHIYAIGIGLTDTTELDGIASVPASENSFAVQEFSELRALRDKVFEAFCPGTPAPITLPPKVTGCADAKIDLVFILDASTSVTEPNFELMKDFVKDFLFVADIDNGNVRVGVIIYSTEDYLQFNLNEYSSKFEVFDAIDEIPYRYGSTNTADALKTMRTVMYTPQNGDRPNVPNICIVVTDGVSNINSRRTIPEAEQARADGIHIYAIGIGLTDTTELDGIASIPASENSFAVQEFSELRALRDKVFEAFCPGCADAKIDLVFILDASTSVTEPNFELMKDFVKDFLFVADIDNGNVRVGVIIYSTEDYLQFNLNEHKTKFEVFDAIDEIPYRYGSTNTADALKTMRTVMYTPQNGDRPNVPNICIVVTDGVSNINSRRTIPEAEQARADGIHIYAIGIGLTDTTELDGIASIPASENSFAVQEFSELRALRDKVFEAFCPGCADAEIDLVFILDASTSVTEPNFELMKDFVKDFLFIADIDSGNVRVGVIIYSTEDYLQFNLNEYKTKFEVFDAIDEIPYRYGSTNTADALKTMRTVMYTPQNGDRPNVPNICIVVTDGVSNINSRKTIPEAEQARAEGIHIYAIGIGLTDTRELDGMASVPASENSFAVQEFSELRALRDKVFEAFCPGCADAKIDLVFILDASTSVTEPNFELMKDFVKDFLFVADIDNGNVRVGVIIYSTEDYLQFNLNEYKTKFEVFDAIDEIPYRYGSTNTADALKTMRTVMYTPQNGDRPNVPNICIVVTDGVSNINSRRTIPEAEQARADGIHIYAIGIGLTDTTELDGMASVPASENSFAVQEFSELRALRDKVFEAFCPGCADAKIDLVFILDASTSVTEPNFELMKDFVKDFLFVADIDNGNVRVGVIIYSTEDYLQFNLNEYKTKFEVFDAIDEIPYRYGSTNTADALKTMRTVMYTPQNGDRPNVPNICIVVTDGVSNINSRRTIPEAEQARADGIHIYAIGIGLTDTTELDGMASVPASENSFAVQEFSELRALRDKVFEAFCPGYQPPEPTTGEKPVITLPPEKPGCADAKIDLVFILDASTSVTEPNFELMKDFVKDFLFVADIDSGNVRVGVVIYSTEDYLQFNLNEYSSKFEVFDAIDEIPYRYGSTNTADALKTMRTVMYTPQNGDRPNVPNICIVVTDGVSNINSRRTIPEAEQARADGIHIYAIGIGLTDTTELDGIASVPASENSFAVQEFSELRALRDKVFEAFCPGATTPVIRITLPPAEDCAFLRTDLVIVIDSSTSVTETNFVKILSFIKDFLSSTDIDSGNVRVAISRYSSDVEVQFNLNEYRTKAQVLRAVDRIKYIYGSTNTADALKVMRNEMFTPVNGDRPDVPNVAVVITDGVSNVNSDRTIPEAEAARDDGIHIYTIGIGLTDTREMDAIATPPASANSFSVKDLDELRFLHQTIFASICPEDFTMPPTTRRPPPTTPAPTTPRRPVYRDTGIDMIFMLDSTVNDQIFGWMKNFVRRFASELNVDNGEYRIGAMTFTSRPNVQFHLNRYNFQDEVIGAVDSFRTQRGRVDPASAFDYVYQTMFTGPNGDRPRARNYVVMLTGNERSLNMDRTFAAAQRLKDVGTDIYTVGINLRDTTEIDGVSSKPTDQFRMLINNESDLDEIPGMYKYRMENVYSDTGYDVVFMLDSTVNDQIFGWMKDFVRRFAGQLRIDNGIYRVGAMTFTSRPNVEFHLNRYNFQDEVMGAVDKFRTRRGRVDMARAFDYVRQTMFSNRNGDRPRARNYVVMLTGNEKSMSTDRAISSAQRLQDLGTDIYTVGINLRDTTEIDGVSSKPLDEFQMLVNSEREMEEIPGIYLYRMENAPPPFTRTTTTTTPRPTTRRPTRPTTPYTGECESTGDVTFILDSSGSVGEVNFDRVRNFTISAIRDLEIDNGFFRVAVVTFSDSANIEFYLNSYVTKDEIVNAIRNIPYVYGFTHTADALRRTRTEIYSPVTGDRAAVPNLVVIVTDGESNVNPLQTLPEANRIKRTGTSVITVAVGLSTNAELVGLTSPPIADNLIYVDDFEALHRLSDQIVAPLCSDSNLCDESPCRNEGVCVDGLRSYMCVCQPGFFGDNCEKECGPKTDVVFILDSSTSVGTETFNRIKMYAEILMRSMNVDYCDVSIGAMKYSSAAMIQFRLGEYDDTESLSEAINAIGYTRGRANMADALRVLRTEMFNGRNGDRPDAKNVAYLLTDGGIEINRDITLSEADLIIDSGVRLIPLAVALRQRAEIELIANAQGIPLMEIESETKLEEMSDQVLEVVFDKDNRCNNNPCLNGGRCINEPLGFRCECADGWTGDTCEKECRSQADVAFVLDASRYNSRRDVRNVKKFARDIVKRMAFRQGNFRVGVVEFSSNARTRLTFAEGDNKRTVKSVIGSIRPRSEDPNPLQAIQRVDADIVDRFGDRENVPNYVVFVTSSVGGPATVEAINELKRRGTRIVGVGINLSSSDMRYMEAAVSEPVRDMMFTVTDTDDLESISESFVNFVCDEQNLCLENPCKNGGVCSNGNKDYMCNCRPGYAGKNCDR
ncbi:hypothetical protein BaRGS_00006381, partial [Batillaria attramentaria]